LRIDRARNFLLGAIKAIPSNPFDGINRHDVILGALETMGRPGDQLRA
jgi:hypothetical protein